MKMIFYFFLLLFFLEASTSLFAQDEMEIYKNEMYLDEGYYYPDDNDSWEDEYNEAVFEQQEYEEHDLGLEEWEEESFDESQEYNP